MKRREFVLLAGSAALVPFAAQAQQRTTRVIGFLHTSVVSDHSRRAFIAAMADAGYTEGRNLAIIYRFAESRPERLPDLALELVQRNVEVIFAAGGSVAAKAAKAV